MDDRSLASYFAELAGRLFTMESVPETMSLIVQAAVDVVDACDHCSLSFMRGKSLVSASSSDAIGVSVDGIQTGAQEGPCLDAIRLGEVIVSAETDTDPRWPVYGPLARESAGVVSSMAYPLRQNGRVVGALNLFAETRGAFTGDEEQEALVAILAAHASPALASAVRRENMEAALRNRDVIGQAKGMLMARSQLDEDQAFAILVRASQRMNVKLAEVARRLVEGSLDQPPPP